MNVQYYTIVDGQAQEDSNEFEHDVGFEREGIKPHLMAILW